MRFLFVFHRSEPGARVLLQELGVVDVTLIVLRQGQSEPTKDELAILVAAGATEGAACAVVRKYRRNIPSNVRIIHEPSEFRADDRVLRDWLVPPPATAQTFAAPSVEFKLAASSASRLVLVSGSLDRADELPLLRYPFAGLSARLLARLARGEALGPMREWKEKYQVDFAANGRVAYKYTFHYGSELRTARTEWHLKMGDRTADAARASRIYFEVLDFSVKHVAVFFVGPHPDDGDTTVPAVTLPFP